MNLNDLTAENERLRKQVVELTGERDALKRTVEDMQVQITFLTSLPQNADGLAAEIAMSRLLNLPRTPNNSSYDLGQSQRNRYEVKYSKDRPKPVKKPRLKEWSWTKVLGSRTRRKEYDYLLLLGEPDQKHRSKYRDPESPYVIFLIPYGEVEQFTTNDGPSIREGDPIRRIILTTNPDSRKSLDSKKLLYSPAYQKTREELEAHRRRCEVEEQLQG